MLVTYIDRGNEVDFTARPLDANGDLVTPDEVNLFLSFVSIDGGRALEAIEMDEGGSSFTATWDSSIARPGRVHWSVRTFSPASAKDGFFDLRANLANPDPESET
jgi:hypothetical protein